ncbi:MAG TPA: hypothetical protein VMR74_07080 [Gammaproteobacteria bacterium]|nr:hypothetical protein [Gammaproteobacteria bacterium]
MTDKLAKAQALRKAQEVYDCADAEEKFVQDRRCLDWATSLGLDSMNFLGSARTFVQQVVGLVLDRKLGHALTGRQGCLHQHG